MLLKKAVRIVETLIVIGSDIVLHEAFLLRNF